MNSRTTASFRRALQALPSGIRFQATQAYKLFRADPHHPSLHFKRVHSSKPIYSARVSLHYRALGVVDGSAIVWFWVGSHDDYERVNPKA